LVFQRETEQLLQESNYDSKWSNVWLHCPEGIMEQQRSLSAMETLEAGTDYYFRVILNCETFPWLLAWIVFSPWDERCKHRCSTLQAMLDLLQDPRNAASASKSAAYKLAVVFEAFFRLVIADGGRLPQMNCSVPFFTMMNRVLMMLPDNSQLIEGENGVVKAVRSLIGSDERNVRTA